MRSDPSGQGRTAEICTSRPSQKLYIGERSGGEADADVARRAIASTSTTVKIFHTDTNDAPAR